MKLSKIVALCKATKHIVLYDTPGSEAGQWIGVGEYAAYPLGDIPELDEKAVCILFDIPQADKDKYAFAHRGIPADIAPNSDEPSAHPVILPNGLIYLKIGESVIFYESRFAAPLADEHYTYHIRGKYVVLKAGMLVRGIIAAVNVSAEEAAFLLEQLDLMKDAVDAYLQSKKPDPTKIRLPYKD